MVVKDVEGVQAGKEVPVMSVRESENAIFLGYNIGGKNAWSLCSCELGRSCLAKFMNAC